MTDMLDKTGVLEAKPAKTPLETSLELELNEKLLQDPTRFKRLVGKLIYLTFMQEPRMPH